MHYLCKHIELVEKFEAIATTEKNAKPVTFLFFRFQ
jgi:hypothetical protein